MLVIFSIVWETLCRKSKARQVGLFTFTVQIIVHIAKILGCLNCTSCYSFTCLANFLCFKKTIFEIIIYLDSIFGGAYGSERENRLEKEYDLLIERKNHIDQAHFKWKQALIMVKQACSQLGLAVQKWKELSEIPEK